MTVTGAKPARHCRQNQRQGIGAVDHDEASARLQQVAAAGPDPALQPAIRQHMGQPARGVGEARTRLSSAKGGFVSTSAARFGRSPAARRAGVRTQNVRFHGAGPLRQPVESRIRAGKREARRIAVHQCHRCGRIEQRDRKPDRGRRRIPDRSPGRGRAAGGGRQQHRVGSGAVMALGRLGKAQPAIEQKIVSRFSLRHATLRQGQLCQQRPGLRFFIIRHQHPALKRADRALQRADMLVGDEHADACGAQQRFDPPRSARHRWSG